MEKIKEYLDCGKYSLNEIACMMNFQNMNYMIRLFKSTTGLTIREYKGPQKSGRNEPCGMRPAKVTETAFSGTVSV